MTNLSRITAAAELKFGTVIAATIKNPGLSGWLLTIERDRPTFADRPYMQITAYFDTKGEPAFEHGHYDLTAEQAGIPEEAGPQHFAPPPSPWPHGMI